MSDNDSERLKRELLAQVKRETRWVRRAPMLFGALGLILVFVGVWCFSELLMTLGSFIVVVGFGAQVAMWLALRGEDKL